ncbi:DUF6942 family protein [Shewanella sp. YIC-542]|uniref:DUF6942 family protein n=1 Tax=Shewanella mytili TaxID=3377111 RepID=UPI00398EC97D
MFIGNPQAAHIIYLPHSPLLPPNWHWQQADACAAILQANSNHWRKILVIAAKIFSSDDNWRQFLHGGLLREVCLYTEAHSQRPVAGIQLFSGQAVCHALALEEHRATPLASCPKLCRLSANAWLVPYLDYRQFPNWMIALLRQQLVIA